jgi:hypothetical protein
MAVMLSNLKEHGYFKTVIHLADAFDAEDEAEIELAEQWEGATITIRELNARETSEYRKQAEEGYIDNLAAVIVDHNIYREEGKKASTEEVAEIIGRSQTMYMHVLNKWMASLPLAKRSRSNSEK